MRHTPSPKRHREPTITLINVVFLMLIFFLIAGTLAPPLDPDLTLVETDDLDGREPPDALVISAGGEMMYRGQPMDAVTYLSQMRETNVVEKIVVRIVPDRALAAQTLLKVGRKLQAAGADQVFLVTQRNLE